MSQQLYFNDAVAVDMEGYGFFSAVQHNKEVNALLIRGISDQLDNKAEAEREGSQVFASQAASAFAFEVLSQLFDFNPVIVKTFPRTNDDYEEFFKRLLKSAQKEIVLFGLGKQFYINPEIQELLYKKSKEFKVKIYVMNPYSPLRELRYKLEPLQEELGAAYGKNNGAYLHNKENFVRRVLVNLKKLKQRIDTDVIDKEKGISIKFHEINLSFAMEFIDDYVIIILYGYKGRTTLNRGHKHHL